MGCSAGNKAYRLGQKGYQRPREHSRPYVSYEHDGVRMRRRYGHTSQVRAVPHMCHAILLSPLASCAVCIADLLHMSQLVLHTLASDAVCGCTGASSWQLCMMWLRVRCLFLPSCCSEAHIVALFIGFCQHRLSCVSRRTCCQCQLMPGSPHTWEGDISRCQCRICSYRGRHHAARWRERRREVQAGKWCH